ncbi:hypothetical protein CR513_17840, partial [Mucuna pruriens]
MCHHGMKTSTITLSHPYIHEEHPERCAMIKSCAGAFWNPRSSWSSTFVTQRLEEAIMDPLGRLGIDFIGSFLVSYGNSYILLVVDYVSRWVEARAT